MARQASNPAGALGSRHGDIAPFFVRALRGLPRVILPSLMIWGVWAVLAVVGVTSIRGAVGAWLPGGAPVGVPAARPDRAVGVSMVDLDAEQGVVVDDGGVEVDVGVSCLLRRGVCRLVRGGVVVEGACDDTGLVRCDRL